MWISLYAGFLLALPVVLYQLWSFFAPAFAQHTQRVVVGLTAFAAVLGGGRARVRVLRRAARGRPLPHELRLEALRDPDPRAGLPLLRRGRPVRGDDRLRDADRHPRPRADRDPQLGEAAPQPAHRLRDDGRRRGRPSRRRPGHDDDGDGARSCCSSRARSGSRSSWSAASRRPRRRYSERPMARAAVKAKAKQARRARSPRRPPARRPQRRRGHAGGGNPNQDLFFTKLRKRAKLVYVILAVLFAITFAFLGVGSGSDGGLDQLFQRPEHLPPRRQPGLEGAEAHQGPSAGPEGLPRPRDRLRVEGRHRQRDHRAPAVHEHEAEGREGAGASSPACR